MNLTARAALLAASLLPACATTPSASCPDHSYTLAVESYGPQHTERRVMLNGVTPVTELDPARWSVEGIDCTSSGFSVLADPVPVGAAEPTLFQITVTGRSSYEISGPQEQEQ